MNTKPKRGRHKLSRASKRSVVVAFKVRPRDAATFKAQARTLLSTIEAASLRAMLDLHLDAHARLAGIGADHQEHVDAAIEAGSRETPRH